MSSLVGFGMNQNDQKDLKKISVLQSLSLQLFLETKTWTECSNFLLSENRNLIEGLSLLIKEGKAQVRK